MLLELLPSKLVFPTHSPPLTLTYFPDYVRNPDERPRSVSNATFWYWNDWRIIVLLSSLFLSGLSFTGSWTWENSTFFFLRDCENRTRDLTVPSSHVLPSTPLWGSRQNVTQQKLLELLPSKLVFPTHQTVEPPEPTTIPTSSRLNTQMATFTSCNPQLYRTFYSRCIHFPASSSTTNSPHTRVNYVARCLLL